MLFRTFLGIAAAGALTFAAGSPSAQPTDHGVVKIQAFSLAKTQALGEAMYAQDQAAWKASDLMQAAAPNLDGYFGWIASSYAGGQRVRYLKGDREHPSAGYEVVFDGQSTPLFQRAPDSALTAEEAAQFRALGTAMQAKARNCSRRPMNHIEIRDPDSGEWLVYLMTGWTDEDGIPMGGHTRVTVSADGSKILREEQMSMGCLAMKPPAQKKADEPAMMFAIQLVADTPLETYVFNALQSHVPIVVGTPDRTMWIVDGESIANGGKIDDKPPPRRR